MRLTVLVLVAALAASGCGFEPLYAKREGKADVPEQLAKVRIGEIYDPALDVFRGIRDFPVENDRSRLILKNYLIDNLSAASTPSRAEYVLNVQLVEPRTNLAIDRSDTTLRYGYSVIANFQLQDTSGRSVFASTASSSTTFQVSQSEFATIASQRDARDRAMEEISNDIRNQLATYFYSQAKRAP